MHTQAWGLVNDFMAEMAPTWGNLAKKKKLDEEGLLVEIALE